jgi:hypothetical protein
MCERQTEDWNRGSKRNQKQEDAPGSLKLKQEAENLKANEPYRQAQIGSEEVKVKRMTPIDKHK